MDIKSECKAIETNIGYLEDKDKLETAVQEYDKLIDKAVIHYYSGSTLHSVMEENFPNWKFEAEDIVRNSEHKVYKLSNSTEFTTEDIREMAQTECEILAVSRKLYTMRYLMTLRKQFNAVKI